jgi:hypothetical protein
MTDRDGPDLLSDLKLPGESDLPWWGELLMGSDPVSLQPEHRPVWNASVREDHRALFGATGPVGSFYALPTFYARLGEVLERARREGQPLTVVVVQLPDVGPQERRQRELELAVRLSVRREDLPGRLAPTTLAVALSRTGAGAGVVALRLQRVLSRLAGGQVGVGTACHPIDGSMALLLLRAATLRSLAALPEASPDPELIRLLGPLNPSQAAHP